MIFLFYFILVSLEHITATVSLADVEALLFIVDIVITQKDVNRSHTDSFIIYICSFIFVFENKLFKLMIPLECKFNKLQFICQNQIH